MTRRSRHGRVCRRSVAGLSLVELLVTIAILAVGLVGVSSMFIVAFRTQTHAHFTTVASDLAVEKLEEMRAAGYHDIEATTFPAQYPVPELPQGTGFVSVQPYPQSDSPNQYLCAVTIVWGGDQPLGGRVSLQSIIANHG